MLTEALQEVVDTLPTDVRLSFLVKYFVKSLYLNFASRPSSF